MFTLVGTWPLWAQFGIAVLVLASIIYISRFGNLIFTRGKTKLGLGRAEAGKRTCGDCVLILFGKGKKHEVDRDVVLDRILKDQMNFVEQKIIEIQFSLFQSYRRDVIALGSDLDQHEQDKQYKQYCETLKNAIMATKDEIRRSYKENGFHDLRGAEYSNYVKDKSLTLISIAKSYMIDHYPHEKMAVSLEHRFAKLDVRMVEDLTFEVFNKAKEIRIDADEKVDSLDQGFKEDIDSYVETQCN